MPLQPNNDLFNEIEMPFYESAIIHAQNRCWCRGGFSLEPLRLVFIHY